MAKVPPPPTASGAVANGATGTPEKYIPIHNDDAFNNTMLPGEQIMQGGTPPQASNQQVLQAIAQHFHLNVSDPNLEQKVYQVLSRQAASQKEAGKKPGTSAGGDSGASGFVHDLANTLEGGFATGGAPSAPGKPAPTGKNKGKPPSGKDIGSIDDLRGDPNAKANAQKGQQHAIEDIAAQMHADPLKEPLTAIAEKLHIKIPAGAGPTVGGSLQQETAGENWRNFLLNNIQANGSLTKNGVVLAAQLEHAGFLRKEDGSKPTANELQGAYKNLLDYSIYTKSRPSDVITAKTQENTQLTGGQKSEAVSYVEQVASQLGVSLSPEQENAIVTTYTNQAGASGFGSVADEIKRAVAKAYDPTNPNNPPGLASSIAQGIQSAANDLKVPLSQGAIGSMVQTALSGGATDVGTVVDQLLPHLQQQAAGLYPTLAPMILTGSKVKDLVDPYNAITEQYTGKAAADINNEQNKPGANKYDAFLQGGPKDPKTGAPTMMTLDQWKKTIMSDPNDAYGFQKSTGGKNMASQLVSAILNELGRVTTSGSSNQDIGSSSYSGSPGSANT